MEFDEKSLHIFDQKSAYILLEYARLFLVRLANVLWRAHNQSRLLGQKAIVWRF